MENDNFIWSGHEWDCQEDMAWFIDAERDVLCCLNFQTGECDGIAKVPNESVNKFMQNTRCIKVENEIFCMPCYGNKIWIYDLLNKKFEFIEVENVETEHPYMENAYLYEEQIYAISRSMRKAVVIDVKTKKVTYYPLNVSEEDKFLGSCIRVEREIYYVSFSNRIYMFDMDSKRNTLYSILDEETKLTSICFDGEQFWMSGYRKQIYIWNKKNNSVRIVENFPKIFGSYLFSEEKDEILDCEPNEYDVQLFCQLKLAGNYIWAIPYRTNFVLYIHKDTLEIQMMFIEDEDETKESLMRKGRRPFKFFWQYLRNDRFIGIFSLKNNCILEIDSECLEARRRKYMLSVNYARIICAEKVMWESNSVERMLFARALNGDQTSTNSIQRTGQVGRFIYNSLK